MKSEAKVKKLPYIPFYFNVLSTTNKASKPTFIRSLHESYELGLPSMKFALFYILIISSLKLSCPTF